MSLVDVYVKRFVRSGLMKKVLVPRREWTIWSWGELMSRLEYAEIDALMERQMDKSIRVMDGVLEAVNRKRKGDE